MKEKYQPGVAYILPLLTFNILFSGSAAESKIRSVGNTELKDLKRRGRLEKHSGFGEHYLGWVWKSDTLTSCSVIEVI